MSDEHYNCGMCGDAFPNRDAYVAHLVQVHPETWLARRAITEQALREKKQRGTSK